MLDIQDLKVALDGEAGVVRAIDGLRLTIQRGETFALVGESGCGKSMTALALMRLLPENGRVTAGRIELEGQDTLALAESQMRAVRGGRIGMIFQEPATSLNPVMKVGQQIVEAIETHTALRGDAARAKAVDWLLDEDTFKTEFSNPFTFTTWLAGGGIKGGVTHGASDEWSFRAAEHPTFCYDVHATVLHLLGIDHTRLTYRHNGIDRRLTDVHGEVIEELVG